MAWWVPLAIMAGSTLLKHQNEMQAQRRREAIGRSMEAYQRTRAREGEAATEELLKKQTPQEREAELGQVTTDRTQSLRDTVGAAQAFEDKPIAGKLSGDYERTQEAEATARSAKLKRAIEQLGAMGAPGEQQQKFGLRFGKAAGRVDAANRAGENVGRAYMTDIENVRADPFLALLSQVGMGVGLGMSDMAAGEAAANASIDAGVNSGQGYEDASGNLYDPSIANRQDASIQRQLAMKRAFSLWGL